MGAETWVGQGPTPETAILASFYSWKFATIQLDYPIHKLKLLAIVNAVDRIQAILYGTTFTIVTNNKLFSYFMTHTIIGKRLTR
jgi:hypothetical protein